MPPNLETAFSRLIDPLKLDTRCKGGWHYGSVGRGEADEYSGCDPVWLVDGKDFGCFADDVPKFIRQVCDELHITWLENYIFC
jgi:hypothetical protein